MFINLIILSEEAQKYEFHWYRLRNKKRYITSLPKEVVNKMNDCKNEWDIIRELMEKKIEKMYNQRKTTSILE